MVELPAPLAPKPGAGDARARARGGASAGGNGPAEDFGSSGTALEPAGGKALADAAALAAAERARFWQQDAFERCLRERAGALAAAPRGGARAWVVEEAAAIKLAAAAGAAAAEAAAVGMGVGDDDARPS